MAIYQNATGEQLNLTDEQANKYQGGASGLAKSGYFPTSPVTSPVPAAAPKTEVSMIDTGSAISQVNKQNSYLNSTYPTLPTPAQPAPTSPTVTPTAAPSGKAYFVNQAGQEAEYTQDQLNSASTQQFLKNNGYILTKSDGVNVNGDFSTSALQKGVDEANNQIQGLANDFLNYNVDNDPDFQGQAQVIKGNFAKLRSAMEKTNYQRQRAFETLGLRNNTTQYANGIQVGIEGEELNQANQRLADITRDEAATLSAARIAFKTGKYNEFNQKVNVLKDLRDQKATTLSNYNKAISDYTKKVQDENKSLLDQQRFEFDVYKFEQEQKAKKSEAKKPLILSPGQSVYDPETYELVGRAPDKPIDNKPITEKVGNSLLQWNPNLGTWNPVYTDSLGASGSALDWAAAISNGTAKLTEVPSDLRSQVVTALNNIPPDQSKIAPLKDKVNQIDDLINQVNTVGKGVIGPNFLARQSWLTGNNVLSINKLTGQEQEFVGSVKQLISKETLDSLINLKAQGGTLGALSDGERETLQNAATKISQWEIKDKNGNGTGVWDISETAFKKELENIKMIAERAIEKAGGRTVESAAKALDEFYLKNPEKRAFIDQLSSMKNPQTGQPYTEEEKAQILGIPFSQGGSGTPIATKAASIEDGTKGGQCGRFVNNLTGLGLGDSYHSKLAKMDPNIVYPEPGMVFVMPYADTGHTGIILAVNDGIATVKDSNYSLNQTVRTHQIPVYKMTGFRRV